MKIQILQGEKGLVAYQNPSGFIHKIIHRAASLNAFSAVCTSPVKILAQAAFPAITDTQCPVYKKLDFAAYRRTYRLHRIQTEFPLQHYSAAPCGIIAFCVLNRPDSTLGRCMQGNLYIFPSAYPHVTDDKGIGSGLLL